MLARKLTFEPRVYSPEVAQRPLRTNLSPLVILLITSISNPTAASATSSENTSPVLVTVIPRRRHSAMSI
ncbi:hypothetical protein Hanom_Chr04g00369941 [Helianthus anomalus]